MGGYAQEDDEVEAVDVEQREKDPDNFQNDKNRRIDKNKLCQYIAGLIFVF